jgi:hypothetical protein
MVLIHTMTKNHDPLADGRIFSAHLPWTAGRNLEISTSRPVPNQALRRLRLRREPANSRPQMPPLHCGCIVNSGEELKSWVINSMPHQLPQGMLYSTAVYNEMRRTLEEEPPGRRHKGAIIPIDADSSRMMALFFDTYVARHNRFIRMKTLYSNVYVYSGVFDEFRRPRGRPWLSRLSGMTLKVENTCCNKVAISLTCNDLNVRSLRCAGRRASHRG